MTETDIFEQFGVPLGHLRGCFDRWPFQLRLEIV